MHPVQVGVRLALRSVVSVDQSGVEIGFRVQRHEDEHHGGNERQREDDQWKTDDQMVSLQIKSEIGSKLNDLTIGH